MAAKIKTLFNFLVLIADSFAAPTTTKTIQREHIRSVISTGDMGFFDDENYEYMDPLQVLGNNRKTSNISGWDDELVDNQLWANNYDIENLYGNNWNLNENGNTKVNEDNADKKREITYDQSETTTNAANWILATQMPSTAEDAMAEEYKKQINNVNNTFHLLNTASTQQSIEESLENVIKVKNCTQDLGFDLGFKAYACLDKSNGRGNSQLLQNLFVTWSVIGSAFAVVFWCRKGWCSCCCPCAACKTLKRTDIIKQFIAENPPGQWQEGADLYNYEPSEEEVYIYEKILYKLMTL